MPQKRKPHKSNTISINGCGTVNITTAPITVNIKKCVINVSDSKSTRSESASSPLTISDDAHQQLMARLSPIFYGIEDYVNEFLKQAQVADSQHMIRIVKQMVAEHKISNISCRRTLWQVLHEFELYTRSESNWNQQMRKKEK